MTYEVLGGNLCAESASLLGAEDGHAFMRFFRRQKAGAFLGPVSLPFPSLG